MAGGDELLALADAVTWRGEKNRRPTPAELVALARLRLAAPDLAALCRAQAAEIERLKLFEQITKNRNNSVAVFGALTDDERRHTSVENIVAALDAVVRLVRQRHDVIAAERKEDK